MVGNRTLSDISAMRLTLLLMLLGLFSAPAGASENTAATSKAVPAAAPKAKPARTGWIASADMPEDSQHFDGKPLYLKITLEKGVVTKTEVATEETANLTVTLVAREKDNTMLSIKSNLDVTLKIDLYISPDNIRYQYTSSCPIIAKGGAFETWGFLVNWFALSDLRVISKDAAACE